MPETLEAYFSRIGSHEALLKRQANPPAWCKKHPKRSTLPPVKDYEPPPLIKLPEQKVPKRPRKNWRNYGTSSN